VIVDGTARDARPTKVTWGTPEVSGRDGARPDRDRLP
jgi:hypothetical protein